MALTMTQYNYARRLHSPALWGGSKIGEINAGEFDGCYFFDDFINQPQIAVGAAVTTGKYVALSDTGSTFKQGAGNATGVLELQSDATANDELYLTSGGNAGGLMQINTSGSRVSPIWFEARLKVSLVADGDLALLVGFAEEGAAAADFIVDGGATFVDKDWLGFRIPIDDGNTVDFAHHKAGGGTLGGVETMSNVGAITADTYFKVGFCYDPQAPNSKKLKFYFNGAEQSTYGTNATLALATFPTGEEMSLFLGYKTVAATAKLVSIDWWAFCQHG